jgi:outer membrane receptor protein involved in Fe transport
MMILRQAFALVPGMLLCLTGWSQQNNPPQVPDTVLKSKKDLKEVIVTGKKPLVTRKSDRYIINVESSYLANGNSGLDVLKKSPGIWVDPNGAIRIKGGQGVAVMINDVIQRMSAEELAEYLRSLKSEDISKIEVITNPQAEYEASGAGGIVHIVLKKAKKEGYSGFLGTQYRQQGSKYYYIAGGSIDYKVKSWYLFGGYSYVLNSKKIRERTDMLYPNKNEYHNYTNRVDDMLQHRIRFGLGVDLSRNQFINIQNVVIPANLTNTFNADIKYNTGAQVVTGISHTDKYRNYDYVNSTFNYLYRLDSMGSKFAIIADYNINHKKETNYIEERYNDVLPDTSYSTRAPFATDIYSVQSDLVKAINSRSSLQTGVKYVTIKRDNESTRGETQRYIYDEQLLMGYATMERSFKKTSVKAGLRAEWTVSEGNVIKSDTSFDRRYFSLFPSFSIMRKLKEKGEDALFLSYSRRIQRPDMSQLNPARLMFSSYTALIGNPNLLPQYTHSIEAGYNFLNGYSVNLYALASTNVISMLVNQGHDNVIEYVFANVGTSTQYGLNASAPVQIGKNWTTNNNFSLFRIHYDLPDRKLDQTAWSVKTAHFITIPSYFDVEAIADYRSAQDHPGFWTADQFYFDIGLSKKVWKKHLTIKLYCEDIFNTLREYEITNATDAQTVFYRKRPTRTVSLSLTYNFKGGLKFNSRKVESGNSDESRRAG